MEAFDWKKNNSIDPLFEGSKAAAQNAENAQQEKPASEQEKAAIKDDEASANSVSSLINPPVSSPENDSAADDLHELAKRKALTGTKRAAQNRNSQRAFRKRKEKYVKELEATAAEVGQLQKTIEELRRENHELRDYTMALQSEVLKLTHSMAPSNVSESS